MRTSTAAFFVGFVLSAGAAMGYEWTVMSTQKIAEVDNDGKVTLAKGWTCEDVLRHDAGLVRDEHGVWSAPPYVRPTYTWIDEGAALPLGTSSLRYGVQDNGVLHKAP